MHCPHCNNQFEKQASCPYCGFVISHSRPGSLGRQKPALLITASVACFLALVGFGFSAYRFIGPTGSSPGTPNESKHNEGSIRPSRLPVTELAVEHGRVATADQFHGHGRLYLVPVGAQAIPVESLAGYYREKFKIDVTVLAQVEIKSSDCVPSRGQCVAEELMMDMRQAYPKVSRNPDSVMIALTNEDIFPRELGWKFAYGLHSYRFAIVSTRRMDPAFWGDRPSEALQLASTRQMLTKYVSYMYFHVPESFDPTSVMYSPFTPNGGTDDIYESDLHSEQSANGWRGKPSPCLFFKYSYQTHEIAPEEPVLTDCYFGHPATSTDEETFATNLGWGGVTERSLDLQLDSTPAIEFRRAYISNYLRPMALGLGTAHNYDDFLGSDGASALTYTKINHEDGAQDDLVRVSPGRGFNAQVVFEGRNDYGDTYDARMTWGAGRFQLRYRDGSKSTFLPCSGTDATCYWVGYQDADGNALHFERGPRLELRELTASDHQGISLKSDDKGRIIEVTATDGQHVSYTYDASGCLTRVSRADGQVTLYEYDPGHHMTSVSVVRKVGAPPETILTNEYDAQGRVVKQTLAGGRSYEMQYLAARGTYTSEMDLTDPSAQVARIRIGDNAWVARVKPVRFQANAH